MCRSKEHFSPVELSVSDSFTHLVPRDTTTANEVTEILNKELQSVLELVASNKLVLNISKTKSIVLGTNHSINSRTLSRGTRWVQESDLERVPLRLNALLRHNKIISPTNTGRGTHNETTQKPQGAKLIFYN